MTGARRGQTPGDPVVDGLDRIARLLALLLAEGKTKTEAILRLAGVGFQPAEIAELLGTTRNTVSVTVHQAKRSAKRTKKSRDASTPDSTS